MDEQRGSGDTSDDASDDAAGEGRIESWEDLIEDWDWIDEDDDASTADDSPAGAPQPLSDTERSALWQRFALVDAIGPLTNAISSAMSQPTMDFEWQYQACYPAFSHAGATLDHEARRIEAAGAEFAPIADALRAEVERQRGVVADYFEDHTDRHRRYREGMVEVNQRWREDSQRAAAQRLEDSRRAGEERLELQRRTNEDISRIYSDIHRKRVESFDRWNRDWLRNHTR